MIRYHKLIAEKSEVVCVASGGVEHNLNFNRYVWVVLKQMHHLTNAQLDGKVLRMIGDVLTPVAANVFSMRSGVWLFGAPGQKGEFEPRLDPQEEEKDRCKFVMYAVRIPCLHVFSGVPVAAVLGVAS